MKYSLSFPKKLYKLPIDFYQIIFYTGSGHVRDMFEAPSRKGWFLWGKPGFWLEEARREAGDKKQEARSKKQEAEE